MKGSLVLVLLFISLSINAQDYYITTTDLNLRSGAGKNYSSIIILEKGDTVKLLENSGGYWAKVQFQDKIGYSAEKYLQKLQDKKSKTSPDKPKNRSSLFIVLIFLFTVIVIAVILIKKGNRYRYKSTAIILSFFLGTYGFQKFYLGENKKGILSILFFWTFIPMLIGLIDFIKLLIMNRTKFDSLYNWGKASKSSPVNQTKTSKPDNNSKVSVQQTKPSYQQNRSYVDDTIIDVNSESLDLTIDIEEKNSSKESSIEPPYWGHSYIYSYDEIKYATKAQKKYYFFLKNKVFNGEFVDIQGNSNYAFILYFDFLNEYQSHRNIELLDKQFRLINKICPKTKNFTLRSLEEELKKNNSHFIDKSEDLKELSYQYEYSDYNSDLYKLGNQYKDKLGLTKKEVSWLNKFYNPSNVFISIEGCCRAVIEIYLNVFNELESKLLKQNSSIEEELEKLFNEVVKIENLTFNEYNKEYEISWAVGRFQESFFITFFKTIENLVREKYGHKRKLLFENYYPYLKSAPFIDDFIGEEIQTIIMDKISGLESPDLDTQITLNTQNVNRWKSEFEVLKSNYKKEEHGKFTDALLVLEDTNQKNPNIENIFYDASKFVAKYHKVQALKYYAKYIYYNLKSNKFDNKELTKTAQKSLFKTDEQINDFNKIIDELIETRDIRRALDNISKIYVPKRKAIQLDRYEIQEVQLKHQGTVELLNTYLVDETGKSEVEIKESLRQNIEIEKNYSNKNNSIFKSEIQMEKIQEELVKMIVNNSYEIEQHVVDKFATENGIFKNQLIDSINEACEELLDGEPLIEEEDENYVIEESYYNEITK